MTASVEWNLPVRHGAFVAYCISCLSMALLSLAALAITVGVAGARALSTPLDGFLAAWGLPLLLGSLTLLLWTMRRGPWDGLALAAAAGALSVAAMLSMGSTSASSGMPGMDGQQSSSTIANSGVVIALLFWTGAALLTLGYVRAWRAERRKVRYREAFNPGTPR